MGSRRRRDLAKVLLGTSDANVRTATRSSSTGATRTRPTSPEVPELEWCPADGATYQEAIANVEVVIDQWIETAKAKGWKIPEPIGHRLLYA